MKKLLVAVALVGLVSTLTGCDPKGAFLGLYEMNGLSVTTQNGTGSAAHPQPLKGTVEVRDGEDDYIIIPYMGVCLLQMEVSGDTAMLKPNSTCTAVAPEGTVNFAFTSGSATVSGNHKTVQGQLAANISITQTHGPPVAAIHQGTFTLTRIGH